MKILVGTLALNNIGITEAWLRSLYKNTIVPDDCEIDVLVVDNGSDESITGMVRRVSKDAVFDTYGIRNPKNIGVAPGWNQILTFQHRLEPIMEEGSMGDEYTYPNFTYDYYVISNNDIWFGHNWLKPLVDTMQSDPIVGWTSCMQNGNDEFQMTKEAHEFLGSHRQDPHGKPNYDRVSMMMDAIYDRWGGFDQFCKTFQELDKEPYHVGHSATCFMVNPAMIRDLGYFNEYAAPIGIHEDHEYWERMDSQLLNPSLDITQPTGWEYRGVNDSMVHHHVCFTRKGPGFGDGMDYEIQREKNWRKMTGKTLFGLPGE